VPLPYSPTALQSGRFQERKPITYSLFYSSLKGGKSLATFRGGKSRDESVESGGSFRGLLHQTEARALFLGTHRGGDFARVLRRYSEKSRASGGRSKSFGRRGERLSPTSPGGKGE